MEEQINHQECIVRNCKATCLNAPDKIFIKVPREPMKRYQWLQLMGKYPEHYYTSTTTLFVCEDHFDMQKDILNLGQYKLMRNCRLVLRKDCIPSRKLPGNLKRNEAGIHEVFLQQSQMFNIAEEEENITLQDLESYYGTQSIEQIENNEMTRILAPQSSCNPTNDSNLNKNQPQIAKIGGRRKSKPKNLTRNENSNDSWLEEIGSVSTNIFEPATILKVDADLIPEIILDDSDCEIVESNLNQKEVKTGKRGYKPIILQRKRKLVKPEMSKLAVYVTRQVNRDAVQILSNKCAVMSWAGADPVPREILLHSIQDKDALFCMLTDKIDKEVLDRANKLKVIATMSVGYDHLDVAEIKRRGIRIGYTPNILTDATAELTVALLLATSRRLLEANTAARVGQWRAWAPFWMCGPGLSGSTVGIYGFGRIGQEVAKRLKPFNVARFLYCSRTEKSVEGLLQAEKVEFEQLLSQSDFILVCCALNLETVGIFNARAFSLMKKTAVFINTSRGGVVDQDALIEALKTKTIWGAGLDVMTPEPLPLDSPLFTLENCVILPHIGSATVETREEMAILTANNIIAALDGQRMPAELIV